MQVLLIGVTWTVSIIIGLFMATILVLIWSNRIDLQYLIAEEDGSASLSRFQLLIFTFVISASYFLLVIATIDGSTSGAGLALPDVPAGALTLLGISGGSYVLLKTIQKVAEINQPARNQSASSGEGGAIGAGAGKGNGT